MMFTHDSRKCHCADALNFGEPAPDCSDCHGTSVPRSETVILQRGMKEDELTAAQPHFHCVDLRSQVIPGSLVIGRYSVLPYYKELEQDLASIGARLINTHKQHRFIADLGNWYEVLKDLTPQTWNRPEDMPEEGPFVVKGETNSKKFQWKTHMYAHSRLDAINVMCRLQEDGLICDQHIYFRKYVPLVKLMDGFQGMPVTEEYRYFICGKQVLCGGFYWSNYEDDIPGGVPDWKLGPEAFLQKVIDRVGDLASFYVVDIAKTQSGEWIVIELNDGQMSGLSCNDPKLLYSRLRQTIGGTR